MVADTRVIDFSGGSPLTIFKQKWKKDTESLRNMYLNHLDDLVYDGMITRARIRTPEEIFGAPPKHVLMVCPSCGVGVAESRVRNGMTESHECPKCHRWIPVQSNKVGNVGRVPL